MKGKKEKFEHKENELEQYIAELKERQDNQYNPGYYIGSGRVGRPLSSLSRYPLIFLILGFLGLLNCGLVFFKTQNLISNLPGLIFGLFISLCFIYGGIARLMKK